MSRTELRIDHRSGTTLVLAVAAVFSFFYLRSKWTILLHRYPDDIYGVFIGTLVAALVCNGGGSGIRTHDTVFGRIRTFQARAFNRSAIPPQSAWNGAEPSQRARATQHPKLAGLAARRAG
jgi:hypothetical protein